MIVLGMREDSFIDSFLIIDKMDKTPEKEVLTQLEEVSGLSTKSADQLLSMLKVLVCCVLYCHSLYLCK